MQLDVSLLLKLEELSRLQLADEDRKEMISTLSNMLNMVEKLNELPTSEVEPLVYLHNNENIWREDSPEISAFNPLALREAPESKDNFFVVPRVLPSNP